MKPVIYEVWGQCARCHDAFSVYLHQRRYRDQYTYVVEPSPHLRTQGEKVYHLRRTCGGRVHLFGFLPNQQETRREEYAS